MPSSVIFWDSSRSRRAIVFIFFVAISNCISFNVGKLAAVLPDLKRDLLDSSPGVVVDGVYTNASSSVGPVAATGSLRGSSAGQRAAAVGSWPSEPLFTSPSPHLWSSIPVVLPHVGRKRVLVTGAAGFIGSHVAEALLERGDEVVVVDEMNDYYDVEMKEENLRLLRERAEEAAKRGGSRGEELLAIYPGDVNNQTLMDGIFEKHAPKWICHLAARAGVRPSIKDPLLYVKANVQGTTNILEYARRFGATNVVLASSSSVYGESDSTYFSEAENVNRPVSPYASTKRSGELMSHTYHRLYGLNVTNLRFFTVYGPRGRPDMAPFKFISRVARGEVIEQYGDGSTSRDYTYVDDIVDGVLRAIDRSYPYEIFNLGKGSGTRLDEFISLVEKHVGRRADIKRMPEQPGDVPFTNADVSKAGRLLGYESRVTTDEGVRRTAAWFKEAYGEDGMGRRLA